MEPDRFDDVAVRIVESPQPPRRPPRGRRWLLVLAACVLATGGLAAGASAIGDGGDEQARSAPPKPSSEVRYDRPGGSYSHKGRGCRKGERERRSSDVRY